MAKIELNPEKISGISEMLEGFARELRHFQLEMADYYAGKTANCHERAAHQPGRIGDAGRRRKNCRGHVGRILDLLAERLATSF